MLGSWVPACAGTNGDRFQSHQNLLSTLLRFDARFLDHLRPLDQLDLDKLAQLLRRAGEGFKSDCAEAPFDVTVVDDPAQLGIEARDDLTRCVGWCKHGRP